MHWLQVVPILRACDVSTTASLLSVVISFKKNVYLKYPENLILYVFVAGCYDWIVGKSTARTYSVISQMIPAY
jgi:hypothetical protein